MKLLIAHDVKITAKIDALNVFEKQLKNVWHAIVQRLYRVSTPLVSLRDRNLFYSTDFLVSLIALTPTREWAGLKTEKTNLHQLS